MTPQGGGSATDLVADMRGAGSDALARKTAMELADERAARRDAAARKRVEALTDEQVRQGLVMRGTTDAALVAEAHRRGIGVTDVIDNSRVKPETGGVTTPKANTYVKGNEIRPGMKTRGKGVTRETMINGIIEAVKGGKQPDYEIHAPKPELTGDAAAEAEAKKIATADKRRRTSVMKNFEELRTALRLDETNPQTNWRGKPDRRADFHYGVMMSDTQIRQLAEAYGLEGLTGQALRDAVFEAIREGRIPDLELAPITSLKKKR